MDRSIRTVAACIAVFAMLAHGLVPTGWMPGGTARAPITICTMDGLVHVTLDGQSDPAKQKQQPADQRGHDICPFAASAHFAAPLTAAATSIPNSWTYISGAEARAGVRQARPLHSPQSPRAPPSLV